LTNRRSSGILDFMVEKQGLAPRSKLVDLGAILRSVAPGATVAFGGGGMQRKPLTVAAGLASAGAERLNVISFLAGPEVDLLIGLGKVSSLQYAYAGFDSLGLSPNFRRARQEGSIKSRELSEGMFLAGVEAGARGVPFHPTLSGTGGDIVDLPGSPVRRFRCPITGRDLIAVPAITPDVLFLHVQEADELGNLRISGDPFLDALLARSSRAVYATADRVVAELPRDLGQRDTVISRVWVSGVTEMPGGSGFTSCYPERTLDWAAAADFQANALDPAWLTVFADKTGGAYA
jgi:glutaconate CoA-transferase, subunit A